jgi:hypothetical protein
MFACWAIIFGLLGEGALAANSDPEVDSFSFKPEHLQIGIGGRSTGRSSRFFRRL